MKVVLFCGGEGLRLRNASDTVPKPMVPVGYRPIIWHVMKYYAEYGHKDFILCLGHQADAIKQDFLNYEEAVSNDFVLGRGGQKQLLATDIDDWTITFVDTGLNTEIGERLSRVREHLEGEDMFLANYADGVTDLDLDVYLEGFIRSERVGGLLAVRPPLSYHVVTVDDQGSPTEIGPISHAGLWLNGGYFAFRKEVFDYLDRDNDWVSTLDAMIEDGQLFTHTFDGFWAPMDTFKDKARLDAIWESGNIPWLPKPPRP